MPSQTASDEMKEILRRVRAEVCDIGIVGGSDLSKQREQLGDTSASSCAVARLCACVLLCVGL